MASGANSAGAGDGLDGLVARNDRVRRTLAGSRFGAVTWVSETGSTNRDLIEAARRGAAEGTVLVADHQTAGRGRLGRTWQAPPGSSLLASVLSRPDVVPEAVHLVTMAVALAAAEACDEVAGVAPRLKWPNDLVVVDRRGPRKVAGILAESVLDGDRVGALVVGIGLNVNWPADLPPDLAPIAVSLNHLVGRPVDRVALLEVFLLRFERWYGAATASPGDEVVDAWRGRSATLGTRVRVELAGPKLLDAFEGRAVDISPEGHLVVLADGETEPRQVAVGDVVHLR